LPSVAALEQSWAQIAKCGVEPASVIHLIDKARKIGGHVLKGFIVDQTYGFDLQGLRRYVTIKADVPG
jgi:hypothetical protein